MFYGRRLSRGAPVVSYLVMLLPKLGMRGAVSFAAQANSACRRAGLPGALSF